MGERTGERLERVREKVNELGVNFDVVAPFFHPSSPKPWSLFDWICGVPLLVIRVSLLFPIITFLATGSLFFFIFLPLFPTSTVLLFLFNHSCRLTCRAILFLLGFITITTSGTIPPPLYSSSPSPSSSSPPPPYIFVANHQSLLDVFVLLSALGPLSFVSKKTLQQIPLLGWMAENVLKCIWVDREKERKKEEGEGEGSAGEIKARVEELGGDGKQEGKEERRKGGKKEGGKEGKRNDRWPKLSLVVFPEGTTSNGLFLTHFFSGAFLPGVAVYPVCVQYNWKRISPTWESIPTLSYFLPLLFSPFHSQTHLHFLPPLSPTEKEIENPSVFGERVRREMGREMGVGVSESCYEEKLIFHGMIRKGVFSWEELGGVYHGVVG